MPKIDIKEICAEFEGKLHIFMDEVLCLEDSYFAPRTVYKILSENGNIHRAVNGNGFFWQRVLNSFQVNFFMTLGRIFDSRDDSFSIYQLVAYCKNNLAIFSKEQLAVRKSKDLTPDQVVEYMRDIPEQIVRANEFDELEQEINGQRDIYRRNYIQIRSAIFGHKSLRVVGNEDNLFARTSISEIESMIEFLNKTSISIWELYNNGRTLNIANTTPSSDFRNIIIQDVEDVLNKLVRRETS
ncbi:MAG: hypothetical protein HZB31_07305 [Nitrospirae bacterium]|nr:hypothetical protein [Nitrospirota bacterium]